MNGPRLKCLAALFIAIFAGCESKTVAPLELQPKSLNVVVESSLESISVGGPVTLTITVKNNTGETIDFNKGSSSCWFAARIRPEGSDQFVSFSRRCTADSITRTLDPGKNHSETVFWRGNTRVGDEVVNVPPGVYEIWGVALDSVSPSIMIKVSN